MNKIFVYMRIAQYGLLVLTLLLILVGLFQDYIFGLDSTIQSSSLQEELNLASESKESYLPTSDSIIHPEEVSELDIPTSKPFYKDPYIIGATALILTSCIASILILYLGSTNTIAEDISDSASSIASASEVSPAIAQEAFRKWTITAVTFVLKNSIWGYGMWTEMSNFRQALELMTSSDLLPYLSHLGINFSIDFEMVRFLRDAAEMNTVDFDRLFSVMGKAPLNAFNNYLHNIFFHTTWVPSKMYPSYNSFVADIVEQYNNYSIKD